MGDVDNARWLDEQEQRAWRAFQSVQAQLQVRLHRQLQADSGLSLADFEVLVALTDRPEPRVRVLELAEAVQWEKSRLSHHLARMQGRGLIERQHCPSDARGAFVVLTPDGRRAIEQAAPGHVETVRELVFDGLTAEQVDALAVVSEIVLERIAAHDAG